MRATCGELLAPYRQFTPPLLTPPPISFRLPYSHRPHSRRSLEDEVAANIATERAKAREAASAASLALTDKYKYFAARTIQE
eukprot:5788263-Prymnesium_polylepis.1